MLFVGDEAEKQALLLGEPDLFFTTPGYDGSPLVMVRLAELDEPRLSELVTDGLADAGSGRVGRRRRRTKVTVTVRAGKGLPPRPVVVAVSSEELARQAANNFPATATECRSVAVSGIRPNAETRTDWARLRPTAADGAPSFCRTAMCRPANNPSSKGSITVKPEVLAKSLTLRVAKSWPPARQIPAI